MHFGVTMDIYVEDADSDIMLSFKQQLQDRYEGTAIHIKNVNVIANMKGLTQNVQRAALGFKPQPARRRAFVILVTGNTPAELEDKALTKARYFFGEDVTLELSKHYTINYSLQYSDEVDCFANMTVYELV